MSTVPPPIQLFSELWTLVQRHPVVVDMVKEKNRIKFHADHPSKAKPLDKVQAADLPELMLTYEGFTGNLRSSSSSTEQELLWSWVLTSGDQRIDEVMLPLSWALFECLVAAHPALLALEYHGFKFVKGVFLTQSRAGDSPILRASNIRGWSTVQSFRTKIVLPTAQLVDNADPPTP